MNDTVGTFRQFIAEPDPRFIEKRPLLVPPSFVQPPVPVEHHWCEPASAEALRWLEQALCGSADGLLDLYREAGGARLFAKWGNPEDGLLFIPVEEMESEKEELATWIFMHENDPELSMPYEEYEDEGVLTLQGTPPPWWEGAVVFSGFGYAPERIFVVTDGAHRGKVFVYEHESDASSLLAGDFDAFLRLVMTDPAHFMRRYGTDFSEVERYEAGTIRLPPNDAA